MTLLRWQLAVTSSMLLPVVYAFPQDVRPSTRKPYAGGVHGKLATLHLPSPADDRAILSLLKVREQSGEEDEEKHTKEEEEEVRSLSNYLRSFLPEGGRIALGRFFQNILDRVKVFGNRERSSLSGRNAVLSETVAGIQEPAATTTEPQTECDRSALPAPSVDLSGKWKPVVTAAFRRDYNTYLTHCGESIMKRNLYSNVVGMTGETICQNGSEFQITGTSPVGSWRRTLMASEDANNPVIVSFPDPDGDMVTSESFWCNNGSVHESWLRGKPRVNGGEFQTKRYLAESDTLICESWFHPSSTEKEAANSRFQPGYVKWTFQRKE